MTMEKVTNADYYVGLSTDDKPIGPDVENGSRLIELDTQLEYKFNSDNQTWVLQNNPAIEALTNRLQGISLLEGISARLKTISEILEEKL